MRKHHYFRRVVTILLLAGSGLALLIFHEKGFSLIGDFLIVQDPLQPSDVIHVIAGDDYRTEYAIQLYKMGNAKVLFFTGGWCTIHHYMHGEHARDLALSNGVPESAIAIDDSTVTSTYMEVERLKSWIQASPEPIQSVIVVSDPFHMRRARWTYTRVLGDDVAVRMAPVPFEMTPYKQAWWTDAETRINVGEEYEKFAYYILRYQLSWGKFHYWLESLDQY